MTGNRASEKSKEGEDGLPSKPVTRYCLFQGSLLIKHMSRKKSQKSLKTLICLFVGVCLFLKSPNGRMEYLGFKVRIVFSTLAEHWSHLGSFNKTWCLDSITDIWICLAQGVTQEKRRIKRIIFIFRSLMSYYGAERADMLYMSPESRSRTRKILRDLTQETKFSDDTRFIKLEWAS